MSTENNLQTLYENSVKILTDLIAFKTVSGEDNNSLINYCDEILKKLGATSFKTFDDEKKRVKLICYIKSKKIKWKKTNYTVWSYRCSSCFKRLEHRSI